jgi:hypothetical protein
MPAAACNCSWHDHHGRRIPDGLLSAWRKTTNTRLRTLERIKLIRAQALTRSSVRLQVVSIPQAVVILQVSAGRMPAAAMTYAGMTSRGCLRRCC